jgi:uncharacterized membrane protein
MLFPRSTPEIDLALLVTGLVVFLGIHLLPAAPGVRAGLVARLGEQRYKTVYSLVSAAGLVLIVAGYAHSGDRTRVFAPLTAARHLAPFAMILSFILFAAANMRGRLRRKLGHPMLIGLLIWSAVHLLANGDRTGTVLFGAFFAYAVIDLVSAVRRHAVKVFEPVARHDTIAIVGGTAVALAVMTFHRLLFGVPVVPWGI